MLWLTLLLFVASFSHARPACEEHYGRISPLAAVELHWLPTGNHVDLVVGGLSHNLFFGNRGRLRDGRRRLEAAARNATSPVVRFKLVASEAEFAELKAALEAQRGVFTRQLCGAGACRNLSEAGILNVPPPFSAMPAYTALYLAIARKLGHRRIEAIELVGELGSPLVLGRFALGVLIETGLLLKPAASLGVAGGVIYLLVRSVDEKGRAETLLVPVEKRAGVGPTP